VHFLLAVSEVLRVSASYVQSHPPDFPNRNMLKIYRFPIKILMAQYCEK